MKTTKFNATLTSREMQAVAEVLLAKNGINVDPIIKDIYPNIDEDSMSVFRCKMALILKGLPEFKVFEGFRKDSSRRVVKYRCIAESSIMGTRMFETIEVWNKDKETEQWVLDTVDEWKNVGSVRTESINWELYESIEESEKHW